MIQLLQAAHPGLEGSEYIIKTTGDREIDCPLPEFGTKGLFTRELEEALLSRKVHAAVHSLKDLPVEDTPGIVIAAIPERAPAHDVLVSAEGWTLSSLPQGARVGTCSLRRSAQLLAQRPDLRILPVRGNVDTRVKKVLDGEFDAIVLAQAGLTRLGLQACISEVLPLEVMLPAPAQAALAVQCRANDTATLRLLGAIHDPHTAVAVHAERAFLSALGGCSLPIAAFAEKNNSGIILMGAVIAPDGKQAIRLSAVNQDAHKLGKRLAELILERGAQELLKAQV